MRIAQISPLWESVPPRKYGRTERVVHCLTEEPVRLGHEVVLFASGDPTIHQIIQVQQVLDQIDRFDSFTEFIGDIDDAGK